LRELTATGRTLVAYVAAPADVVLSEVRSFAAERLPAVMVPARWVRLDALPVLTSGKLDRASLPLPLEDASSPAEADDSPVARVFAEVLGLPRVGAYQSFFELGGHSLLAVHVASALSARLGRPVSVGDVLRHPTPAALGEALARHSVLTPPDVEGRAEQRRAGQSSLRARRAGRG
jgi:hypothetical protein